MSKNYYKNLFDYELLTALSDWQKGWREDQTKRRQLADKLVQACEKLPAKFKKCDKPCYRKRFIVGGEIASIILKDNFFEGIASWTSDKDFAKTFKGLVNPSTKFAMIFKQRPRRRDIIVNIPELWKNKYFKEAVNKLQQEKPELAVPLLNFKDSQGEIILRSNLKGSEIEHIVGVSNSFEEICDIAQIPEEDREELSKRYEKDPNGIPINVPIYASRKATKLSVKKAVVEMKQMIEEAEKKDIPIYNLDFSAILDDLKHKRD